MHAVAITLLISWYDWHAGLITAAGLVVSLFVYGAMQRKGRQLSPVRQAAQSRLVAAVLEYVQGMAVVKAFGLGDRSNRAVDEAIEACRASNTDLERSFSTLAAIYQLVFKVAAFGVLLSSGLLYLSGDMDLIKCLLLMVSSFMLYAHIEMMGSVSALSRVISVALDRMEALKNAPLLDERGEDFVPESFDIRMEDVVFSYDGTRLLEGINLVIPQGTTTAIVGPSGSGKTTLMKMIAGRIKPDAGTITVGATIKIGYYTQEIETGREAGIAYMDPEEKVIDYIRNTAEYVRTTDGLVSASNMLERFLFPAAQQYSPIGKLSGGERRRLNLLRVLMEAPNVLILDEPTNDLDTQTLAILEDYLDSYEGIVIVVSHDRYFLDRVVRRIFAFEGNGEIRQYEGGYTDYVNRLAEEGRKPGETAEVQGMTARGDSEAESAQEAGGVTGTSGQDEAEQADSRNTWKREKKLKFSYKEQREYETIEDDIADLEAKVEQLDADMAENATNPVKLGELLAEKEAAEQALEEKMERWEYLEELAAKIAGQE